MHQTFRRINDELFRLNWNEPPRESFSPLRAVVMSRMMPGSHIMFCIVWTAVAMGLSANAAIFDTFDPARHNRYTSGTTPNPTFFLKDFDLSGIGGRAVLITPRHFVTARHVSDVTATAIFIGRDGVSHSYTSNVSDDLMTTYTYTTVDSNGKETNVTVTAASDIRVFTLPEDVDANITPIPIAVGGAADFIGHELIVFGNGDQAGRNIIDDVDVETFATRANPTVNAIYTFDAGGINGGLGPDELGLVGGDSGRQGLIQVGNELALVGTNFGKLVPEGVGPRGRFFNFTTLLAPYVDDQLAPLVMTTGQSFRTLTVTAVPEPATWLVTTLVIGAIGLRHRHRKQLRVNCTG